jgi:hypothetical protein
MLLELLLMLVKDFCKTLINLKVEDAKQLIKKSNWKCRDLAYKENIFLPDIKQPKTIILLYNKNSAVIDAYPFNTTIKEL